MDWDKQAEAIRNIKHCVSWIFIDMYILVTLVQPINIFFYDGFLIALNLFMLYLWIMVLTSEVDFLNDCIQEEQLEDAVWYWHNHNTGMKLREYLGITEIEYDLWVRNRILPK